MKPHYIAGGDDGKGPPPERLHRSAVEKMVKSKTKGHPPEDASSQHIMVRCEDDYLEGKRWAKRWTMSIDEIRCRKQSAIGDKVYKGQQIT